MCFSTYLSLLWSRSAPRACPKATSVARRTLDQTRPTRPTRDARAHSTHNTRAPHARRLIPRARAVRNSRRAGTRGGDTGVGTRALLHTRNTCQDTVVHGLWAQHAMLYILHVFKFLDREPVRQLDRYTSLSCTRKVHEERRASMWA